MIISGYQGIGKSTLAKEDPNVIDFESSAFFVNGSRPENWHVVYCQAAINLSQQGYDVFVSSHKEVRDFLAKNCKEKLVSIFPSSDMKEDWIKRLQYRYDQTKSDKDFKALSNAKQRFDESIEDLSDQEGFQKVILRSSSYRLRYILSCLRRGTHDDDENESFEMK